jgi:hypothetical protein
MTRTDILNKIIAIKRYKSYLEIGVQWAVNFNRIRLNAKVGVDNDPDTLNYNPDVLIMDSNKFFETCGRKFDLIFIDGSHEKEQTIQDICNALIYLNEGGMICVHDTCPKEELNQIVPRRSKQWTGDVWKAICELRFIRKDLKFCTLDTDWGVTIIERGEGKPIPKVELTWINYLTYRRTLLNIIDNDTFFDSLLFAEESR